MKTIKLETLNLKPETNIEETIEQVQNHFIDKILNRDFEIERIDKYEDNVENKGTRYVIHLKMDKDRMFAFLVVPKRQLIIQTQSFIVLTNIVNKKNIALKILNIFIELINANNTKILN